MSHNVMTAQLVGRPSTRNHQRKKIDDLERIDLHRWNDIQTMLAFDGVQIESRANNVSALFLEPHEGNVVLEIFDAFGDENRDLLSG